MARIVNKIYCHKWQPYGSETAVGWVYFSLPDHSIKDTELIPLELINLDRDSIRKVREGFLISKGKTFEPYGMDRRDEI